MNNKYIATNTLKKLDTMLDTINQMKKELLCLGGFTWQEVASQNKELAISLLHIKYAESLSIEGCKDVVSHYLDINYNNRFSESLIFFTKHCTLLECDNTGDIRKGTLRTIEAKADTLSTELGFRISVFVINETATESVYCLHNYRWFDMQCDNPPIYITKQPVKTYEAY